MKELTLKLRLWQCQVRGPEEAATVGVLVAQQGYRFLSKGIPIRTDEVRETLLTKSYSVWARNKSSGVPKVWEILISIAPDGLEEVISTFSFLDDISDINRLGIGGLLDFEFKDQSALAQPYSLRLRDLFYVLLPVVNPELARISCSMESDPDVNKRSITKRRINAIGWINYFGPAWVAQYGESFFAGLPGHIERLEQGGLIHQLTNSFIVDHRSEAIAIQEQVRQYCASHGLKVVCRVPLSSDMLKLHRDNALEEQATALLQTSLVLTDNTRLKVIVLPWETFTPEELERLGDLMIQVIGSEMENLSNPLTVEINNPPDQILARLRALQRRHPTLNWKLAK